MIVGTKVYVVLGAEGVSEAPEWVRKVEDAEERKTVLNSQRPVLSETIFMDHNKRPYYLVEVLDTVPPQIKTKASLKIRLVRLED